jgi:NitT/TauT family transport system substrate-binding protein
MVNNRPLLAFGEVDFLVGTNLLQAFDAVKQDIPTKVVAAFFQRDPQCLLAHADGPWQTWDDLKQAPLVMGNSGRQTFFLWLNAAHGFPRANLRPYNHNLAPFLNDKRAVMQGFATAEPKRVLDATGREPRVFLLADYGWNSYSTVLETRTELIDRHPETVQHFVDASILGWRSYVDGKNAAVVDSLIKKENPSMTNGLIAYSREKMHKLKLVEGDDANEQALGAIDLKRVRAFYDEMVKAGMYKAEEIDPVQAVTIRFVTREPEAKGQNK